MHAGSRAFLIPPYLRQRKEEIRQTLYSIAHGHKFPSRPDDRGRRAEEMAADLFGLPKVEHRLHRLSPAAVLFNPGRGRHL